METAASPVNQTNEKIHCLFAPVKGRRREEIQTLERVWNSERMREWEGVREKESEQERREREEGGFGLWEWEKERLYTNRNVIQQFFPHTLFCSRHPSPTFPAIEYYSDYSPYNLNEWSTRGNRKQIKQTSSLCHFNRNIGYIIWKE